MNNTDLEQEWLKLNLANIDINEIKALIQKEDREIKNDYLTDIFGK